MPKPMTSGAASMIQSSTARSSGGGVPKGSFASRAQSAAARNSRNSRQGDGGRGTDSGEQNSHDFALAWDWSGSSSSGSSCSSAGGGATRRKRLNQGLRSSLTAHCHYKSSLAPYQVVFCYDTTQRMISYVARTPVRRSSMTSVPSLELDIMISLALSPLAIDKVLEERHNIHTSYVCPSSQGCLAIREAIFLMWRARLFDIECSPVIFRLMTNVAELYECTFSCYGAMLEGKLHRIPIIAVSACVSVAALSKTRLCSGTGGSKVCRDLFHGTTLWAIAKVL